MERYTGFRPLTWGTPPDCTLDDKKNDDKQSNARLGLTLAVSVTRHHSIKLYASKAVATRVGGDFDLIGLALQYRGAAGCSILIRRDHR